MVSEYECRKACKFNNYNWAGDWLNLDEYERAMCVALFRVDAAIEANVSDAHSRHIDREQRRGRRGR